MSDRGTDSRLAGPSTWQDFVQLEEDDLRELIDGALVEVEVPSFLHEHIVGLLIALLGGWARDHRAGRVLGSGYKVKISESRGVMPDVQFFDEATARSAPDHGLETGHPQLVVEVISPSSRSYDRVAKRAWYAEIGVPEYWIIDPELRVLERLVLDGNDYAVAETVSEGEVFCPPSFDGLRIVVDELWDLGA